mmetsp:Transcript_25148/g.58124  ORF Transcript_25148/g.58124 Transcript_25148/m.58124 type:complete len:222 (+) Transcript_25148:477-1142(+)
MFRRYSGSCTIFCYPLLASTRIPQKRGNRVSLHPPPLRPSQWRKRWSRPPWNAARSFFHIATTTSSTPSSYGRCRWGRGYTRPYFAVPCLISLHLCRRWIARSPRLLRGAVSFLRAKSSDAWISSGCPNDNVCTVGRGHAMRLQIVCGTGSGNYISERTSEWMGLRCRGTDSVRPGRDWSTGSSGEMEGSTRFKIGFRREVEVSSCQRWNAEGYVMCEVLL